MCCSARRWPPPDIGLGAGVVPGETPPAVEPIFRQTGPMRTMPRKKCKPNRLPISSVVMTSTLNRISKTVPVTAVSLALPVGLAWLGQTAAAGGRWPIRDRGAHWFLA